MRRGIGQNKPFLIIYTIIAIAAYAAIALLIMYIVSKNGWYPSGSDTMYHIYRGELIYKSFGIGNYYPVYDPYWYNGVEIMRYWPPMAPYTYALCMAIANVFISGPYGGYLVFVGLNFFFGAIVWHIIGLVWGRPIMGSIVGILWFFMPNNLYAMFGEGNLPRTIIMIFLPLYIFAVYQYLNRGKIRYLPIATASFTLMAFCHLGYAGMVALSLILFLIIDAFSLKRYLREFRVFFSTLLGYAITGIYAVPSLVGGVSGVHTTENLKGLFQNIFLTINPFYRYETNMTCWYFGLAAAIVALLGALFSYSRSRPGFWQGLITLLLTSDTAYYVIVLLPGSSALWMLRFISIALCFILMSFMTWKTLRKPILALLVLALVLDTVPSLGFIYGDKSNLQPEKRLEDLADQTLINRAKEITKQRMALLDEGSLGATGAYLPVTGDNAIMTTFGAGWEGSETNKNISGLNKGIDGEAYIYTFDRALELGNDTVIVALNKKVNEHLRELDAAAELAGYKFDKTTDRARIYTLAKDHPDNWGVISNYKAIGIGSGSDIISRTFPYVKEGGSNVLDDYTFDELSKYEMIYLSAFEFKNREYAEDLVVKLGEAGTKVIIAADGVPEDRNAHGKTFLGVFCNPISFSQGFPLLQTIEGDLDTDLFPSDAREWSTVFCDGLDEVWGKVKDENYDIAFLGTVKNDNIIFIGLNLVFYYGSTRDAGVENLLSKVMSLSTRDLPERTIVPIDIKYESRKIIITSDYDNVNTTLAYHNFFNLDKAQYEDNHLLFVPKGVTEIELKYPYFVPGLIVTLLSCFFAILYHVVIFIRERKQRKRAGAGAPVVAETMEEPEVVHDSEIYDYHNEMSDDEFERTEAVYSFFNEKTLEEKKDNFDVEIEYAGKDRSFDVEINTEDLNAGDTEVEDYGIEFEEINLNGYDYDYKLDDIYDDADEEKDDYEFNDINIKE